MSNKAIKARVLLKSDITENWDKVNNFFIPEKGQVCIYLDGIKVENESGKDFYVPKIKIGDGTSFINELEFISDNYISKEQIDSLLLKFSN